MKWYHCIAFLIFCQTVWMGAPGYGQTDRNHPLFAEEMELYRLFQNLQKASDDLTRKQINDTILLQFGKLLQNPQSADLTFDTLRFCGRVASPDGALHIFTWNLLSSDLVHSYFGYVQLSGKDKYGYRVYALKDTESLGKDAAERVYTPDKWYGCLIYKILHHRYRGEDFYTILALDYNNLLSNKKIIDVLWFDDNGKPMFGKPIFKTEKGTLVHRVIFEYNAQAVMGLKWNDRLKMIVYDHLSPIKPEFEGNFKFYGPDFSFDAYKFEKGLWVYVPDVNVVNE